MNWQPDSWRGFKAWQQPDYSDHEKLASVLGHLAASPPLVAAHEVDQLSQQLALAEEGSVLILQAGDCAERFQDCTEEALVSRLRLLLLLNQMLAQPCGKPVVTIGRIAGQFGKPRSASLEAVHQNFVPTFRGEIVNGITPCPVARQPDPHRLEHGYSKAASTLNFFRMFFGLPEEEQARLLDISSNPWHTVLERADVRHIVGDNTKAFDRWLRWLPQTIQSQKHRFFVSHECLILPYEQSLTRMVRGTAYDLSTHMIWVGNRTRQPDGAHIEFVRGLANPVGIKIGPQMTGDQFIELATRINPKNQPGRIVAIARLGADRVAKELPPFIRSVRREGLRVTWLVDPMHGNTLTVRNQSKGIKTRRLEDILYEIQATVQIHQAEGSAFGGLHLECTPDRVTECLGGVPEVCTSNLLDRYETFCDPRLNDLQVIETVAAAAASLTAVGQVPPRRHQSWPRFLPI